MALDATQTVCVVAGLACAVASAFIFGGSVPSWEEDAGNDFLPGEFTRPAVFGGTYYQGYAGAYLLRGCFSTLFRVGKGGAAILALAAVVLIYGFSGLGSNDGFAEDGGGFLMLFDVRLWMLLGAAAVGYVLGVISDKGPVGPLQ